MPPSVCDHTSVGILIWRDQQLLLIERRKPPPGFAPPAGHVDNHGSYEAAAISEVREEVGLEVVSLRLRGVGRRNNPCRRIGGSWHYWKVYEANVVGEPKRSAEETRSLRWANQTELQKMADRTMSWRSHRITDAEWVAFPGLEPVWLQWLKELRVLA